MTTANETTSRPTSVEEMQERNKLFSTDEAKAAADRLVCRPSDVFIATYPKCGTTLLQQMVNTLRTGGDMDFEEITVAVPWLEMATTMGMDPDAEQRANPRAFKTHRKYSDLPKEGRLLHMTRNPIDMADSFFRFFDGWMLESGSVDLNEFARGVIFEGSGSGRFWDHIADWWPERNRENVCILCYEDFIDDPATTIRQVADFAGFALDDELLKTTLHATSIGFMKEHARQFDDHVLQAFTDAAMKLPSGGSASKVASGKSGQARAKFSDDVLEMFAHTWQSQIAEPFGLADYEALRAALKP